MVNLDRGLWVGSTPDAAGNVTMHLGTKPSVGEWTEYVPKRTAARALDMYDLAAICDLVLYGYPLEAWRTLHGTLKRYFNLDDPAEIAKRVDARLSLPARGEMRRGWLYASEPDGTTRRTYMEYRELPAPPAEEPVECCGATPAVRSATWWIDPRTTEPIKPPFQFFQVECDLCGRAGSREAERSNALAEWALMRSARGGKA